MLPEEDFELGRSIHPSFPTSAGDRYEISGLARIFHTDRDEETEKADGVRQTSILTPGCMCTYRPSHNVSLTQDPSGFPASAVDQCEICGLGSIECFSSIIFYVLLKHVPITPITTEKIYLLSLPAT